ncbi:MAG: peptidase M48, Ste24p, partial [Sphingopyxis sp.]|nr:peptidase M48, Ste24p [Sphingopyxis sp.]
MRHPLRLIPILFGALTATPTLASAAAPPTYATLAALEARVAAIGFRLTTANAHWCQAQQPQFGWIWGDLRLYAPKDQPAARAAYAAGENDAAFLAAIAPGSPAASAGLTVGTPVAAINGAPAPSAEGDHPYARVTAYEMLFASLPLRDPAAVTTGA